ncbi:hypothetical protein HKD37_01G000356 [Glycine soja]
MRVGDIAPINLEIEATCRRNNAARRRREQEAQESSHTSPPPSPQIHIQMEEEHARRVTLEDYSSTTTPQFFTSIARPEVQAANTSYPHSLIQLIQGNLFHGEAKMWLHSFKGNNLQTWEEVIEKFLKKYFPESKTAEGKMEISSFHQFPDESLNEALDRFHGLLRKTLTHGYNESVQLNIFIYEALTKTLSKLPQQLQAVEGCHTCGGTHEPGQCMVQEDPSREVNYMGIQNRHRFQGYNQGGLSGFNQGPIGFNQGPPGFNQGRNFTQGSSWRNHPRNQYNKEHKGQPAQNLNQWVDLHEKTSKLEETLNQFMQVSMSNYRSTEASIKNLEIQVGQLAKQMAKKPTNSFGANTEKNPKEECKAVLTRSQRKAQGEKEVEKDQSEDGRTDRDEEEEKKEEEEGEKTVLLPQTKRHYPLPSA